MKRVVGSPVEGDDFWGRETELRLLVESLDSGNHVLLVAQRRIGKTSLMKAVANRLQDRYVCLEVDLQNCASAAEAIAELSAATRGYKPLWEKVKQLFGNTVAQVSEKIDSFQMGEIKVTFRAGLTGDGWIDKGDRIFELLSQLDRPVVILMDEVPILVNRMLKGSDYKITPERRAEVDRFLSWLRSVSLAHQKRVRLVVTGSIGLGPVLKQAGLSATVNHLTPFDLKPWHRDVAYGFVDEISKSTSISLAEGSIETMLDLLGIYIPYHVQLFFDFLYRECKLKNLPGATPELAQHIYETDMLGIRGHAELSSLEERLHLVLGTDLYPLALEFLTEAAVSGGLTPEAALLLSREHFIDSPSKNLTESARWILEVLEHDGYLVRHGQDYRFVSKLIREWWQRRYEFGYVPVAQRGSNP